jgi:hypothetical protein
MTHETTLTIVDPTADRTINLPNVSGTIPVLAAASNTAITSTPAELNILDGATVVVGEINALDLGSTAVGTAIASKAVILDSNKDYTGIRNFTTTGVVTSNAGVVVDEMTIDGDTLTATDTFTIDSANIITLDSAFSSGDAGGIIRLADAGTQFGDLHEDSGNFLISSAQVDKDLIFKGNDGGAIITALTLDMSIGGVAKFGAAVQIPQYLTHLDDTDTFLEFGTDQIDLYAGNAKAITIGSSQVIINQDSADMDFRIESNTSANMFFVDGGNDHICINTSTDAGGVLNIKTTDNTANLVLFSTDADANAGPLLDLMRDSSSPADNDAMGSIRFRGDDDAGNETQYVDVTAYAPDVSDGSEDGQLQFRSVVGGTLRNRFDINPTEVVFNEDGVSLNVRVESDNNANMLYIDGGYNIVGIGRVPATNDGGAGSLQLEGNDGLAMRRNGQTNSFILRPFSSGDGLRFTQGGTGDVAVIDSSGNFGIGTSSPTAKFEVAGNDPNPLMKFNQFQNADEVLLMMRHDYARTDSQTATMIQFQNNSNVEKGTIKTSLNATQFNTSSDYRLKENVNYTWDATTRLKQLKPARFNWISDDTNTLVDGFLAHEVQSIVPQAVDGNKDDMLVETKYTKDDVETQGDNPSKSVGDPKTYSSTEINPQGIDQSKLVPLLVKTIQELEARITALESA